MHPLYFNKQMNKVLKSYSVCRVIPHEVYVQSRNLRGKKNDCVCLVCKKIKQYSLNQSNTQHTCFHCCILFFWFCVSTQFHSFKMLIIVSFGSDLNLRIHDIIWAITVEKKMCSHILYASRLLNLIIASAYLKYAAHTQKRWIVVQRSKPKQQKKRNH